MVGHPLIRRILNGLTVGYTPVNGWRLLQGYLNLFRQKRAVEVRPTAIRLTKIPCYVISLKFRKDRQEKIQRLLSSQFKFKFIQAIHGKTTALDSSTTAHFSLLSKQFLSAGSIGCILSHLTAWEAATHSDSKFVLILEDDINLVESIDTVNKSLEKVPQDFDLLFLGSSNKLLLTTNQTINNFFTEPIYPRCGSFAYILKTTSILKLKQKVLPIRICAGGIDTILGKLVLDQAVKAYHVSKDSPSNIVNPSDRTKLIHNKEFEG